MTWPDEQPVLEAERLVLRPLTLDDAPTVEGLVNTMDIAATVASIPHPYPPVAAAEWIGKHQPAFAKREAMTFAMILRENGELVGCVGIHLKSDPFSGVGEIGYWVAVPHWGRGFATEASAELVRYGFDVLGLHRIEAHHISANPSSGRVMQKLGMQYEGTMRQRMTRFGAVHDVIIYGILQKEYLALQAGEPR